MSKILFFIALIFALNTSAQIYMPNSFTPNNDGINDYMMVYSDDTLTFFELKVYTLSGEIIWKAEDISVAWDGGDEYYVPDGIYIYLLLYRDEQNNPYTQTGHLNIIR